MSDKSRAARLQHIALHADATHGNLRRIEVIADRLKQVVHELRGEIEYIQGVLDDEIKKEENDNE